MNDASDTTPRWSLFTRELEDILALHGVRLGQLDDRKDAFGAPLVHREKVARLKRSLTKTNSFSTLSPEELDRVAEALHFTPEERSRLYAALLATSVEVLLMNRIAPRSALLAAEHLLPLLQQAMAESGEEEPLRAVRGGGSAMADIDQGETTDFESRFEKALDALDRGTLALHLARSADRYQEQIDYAQQAHEKFHTAARLLETATDREQGEEAWRLWHTEAQQGEETAATLLAHFGVSTSESI
jgi:hypothetical protein